MRVTGSPRHVAIGTVRDSSGDRTRHVDSSDGHSRGGRSLCKLCCFDCLSVIQKFFYQEKTRSFDEIQGGHTTNTLRS